MSNLIERDGRVFLNMPLQYLEICTTEAIRAAMPKPYPRDLRKYKKRTLKRWARNPQNWLPAEILQVENKIYCHPSVLDDLRRRFSSGT